MHFGQRKVETRSRYVVSNCTSHESACLSFLGDVPSRKLSVEPTMRVLSPAIPLQADFHILHNVSC